MNFFKDKNFLLFLIKFILIFSFCYFGTLAMIGLAAPGKYYSPFIDHYLDYVSGIKNALITGTRGILALFGIETYRAPDYVVRITNGTGVKIAYDCVGYGVMSFWIAFVVSSASTFKRAFLWILFGILLLYLINVMRITLLLLAYNRQWAIPLGIDHHTWFNIFAYGAIFTMIYFFNKQDKRISSYKATR